MSRQMRKHMIRMNRLSLAAGVTVLGLILSACGSGSEKNGNSGDPSGATADVAAAKALLEPYTGKASAFPVDQPLATRPSADSTFGFLQCVTPICGLVGSLLGSAADKLGVTFDVAKAGGSATSLQTSLDSLVEKKPDAILVPAVEPSVVSKQITALQKQNIPTVSNGIMEHAKFGFTAGILDVNAMQLVGNLLAGWSVERKGDNADIVFYTIPELSFAKVEENAFKAKVKELCPACSVRVEDISVTTIGTSAPAHVVSDLQAHPDTNVAIFSSLEAATGLPAAMTVAGLKGVATNGFGPSPANLQDIKSGGITAGLGLDLPVLTWMQMDVAARLATGQDLTAGEKEGIPPMQMLEQKDITFDPSKGWTGYPDYAERYAKLWGTA